MFRLRPLAVVVSCLLAVLALAAPPSEVPTDARFEADGETWAWSVAAGADAYHVYRGTDPAAYDHACRVLATPALSASLPETPGLGGLLYFLVSAVNAEGESGLGSDGQGGARPNVQPCSDLDGDATPDNLDNCPSAANPSQADQDASGTGDRCDPRTYDFEADVPGARPSETTQLGGSNATFTVRDLGGDLGVAYDTAGGQQDRFDRLLAPSSFRDTTVYVDVVETAGTFSIELWADGAYDWNAGGGIIVQVGDGGAITFYQRRAREVPSTPGPLLPEGGRLRLRLVKGAGTSSTLHVDAWDGSAWIEDYGTYPVADDHRLRGLETAVADYLGGGRALRRITVVHEPPASDLALRKHPSWSSDWKVFQRDAQDVATIPVRFDYASGEAVRVQARVVESIGGAVLPGHDWADHEVTLPAASGGATGELAVSAVPAGGNYDVEVRSIRESDQTVLGTDALAEVAVGDVFVAGGQSNMSGYSGNLIGAEEPVDAVHLFHNDGTWKRASEPMDDGTDQVDLVSSESPLHSLMLRFAKDVAAATGVPVGVIPGPLGGTNLYSQWQRDPADHDNRGTLYASLLHRVLLQNDPVPPVGFLWFQGESDVGRGTTTYRQDLETLLAWYREDLDHPGLYAFVAQLGTNLYSNLENWMAIQEAQRQVAKADPLTALITTVDQPRSDTIHFSVDGYKEIGARFALAARALAYGEPLDPLTELVEVRVVGNGRTVELVYDGDVAGGDPGLYRVRDDGVARGVRSVSASGNVVTLDAERRLTGVVDVSYGRSWEPSAPWVVDASGIAVPAFQEVPVGLQ